MLSFPLLPSALVTSFCRWVLAVLLWRGLLFLVLCVTFLEAHDLLTKHHSCRELVEGTPACSVLSFALCDRALPIFTFAFAAPVHRGVWAPHTVAIDTENRTGETYQRGEAPLCNHSGLACSTKLNSLAHWCQNLPPGFSQCNGSKARQLYTRTTLGLGSTSEGNAEAVATYSIGAPKQRSGGNLNKTEVVHGSLLRSSSRFRRTDLPHSGIHSLSRRWLSSRHQPYWISSPTSSLRSSVARDNEGSSVSNEAKEDPSSSELVHGTPKILLVEPSGAIGYGATLTPLVLVGVYGAPLLHIYVDGVLISLATMKSVYELRLPSIPAHPSPPKPGLLHCSRSSSGPANTILDCEDPSLVTPVAVTITFKTTEATGTIRNITVVLDGKEGRPYLARHITFTPVLLAASTQVQVMQRRPAFTSDRDHDTWALLDINRGSARAIPRLRGSNVQNLTVLLHPQKTRTAGHPQQDSEARLLRFSLQLSSFTFTGIEVTAGLAAASNSSSSVRDTMWWSGRSLQAVYNYASKDSMASNLSFLWSVGEVTGDLSTSTVVHSVEADAESYGLNVVLPSLSQAAHTVTIPATYTVTPNNGVRFVNQDCMFTRWYHDLYIHGAYPRSTLVDNEDMFASLRLLRLPELNSVSNPYYTSVDKSIGECKVSGADDDADILFCRVSMNSVPYDPVKIANLREKNPMDTCGGGVVLGVYTARNMTSPRAASAVVNWNALNSNEDVAKVAGFPVTLPVNSLFRLPTVLEAVPEGWESLRKRAAAAASSFSANGDWIILRFSFIYQNVFGGNYQVHCDGSAVDMQLRIRTASDHETVMHNHCLRSASSASPFRHTIVSTPFVSENSLYINGSCTFPVTILQDADAMSGAFCGVSLEATTVFSPPKAWGGSLLSPYAVYEIRIPVTKGRRDTGFSYTRAEGAYFLELRASENTTTAPIASLSLPALHSDKDCYELPWWVVESDGQNTGTAPAGQRWGGLGYTHQSFIATTDDAGNERRYCHHFLAFRLPAEMGGVMWSKEVGIVEEEARDASPLCPRELRLGIRARSDTTPPVLSQRVFCGSRSFFMDPITPLQLRVPLIEVPQLVDLDALIPNTERGYFVYQYCIDVSFYVAKNGFTGAYAQGSPLVYTIIDTVKAPSHFCPRVSEVAPKVTVALDDTLFFFGKDLRYVSANNTRPLSGAHFAVQLAAVEMNRCEGQFLVEPTGVFPELSAHLVNDTTLALRVTADTPGGWFNMTMTHGDLGEVFVDCGLSIRIESNIISVKTSDVVGPVGGTMVRIRGVNLPMWAGTDVVLTIGYTGGSTSLVAPSCRVTFSLATLMEFATPNIPAAMIPLLSIFQTEDMNSILYWLPINLTTYYTDIHNRRRVFQSINVDTAEFGVDLLTVEFRVGKTLVTSVWPLTVSCMEESPTLRILGAGIMAHSVLLCDTNTISSPERTACIVCMPRGFSSEELVCDVLSPLAPGQYQVYVSDRALEGDSGFTVTSACEVSTVTPDFIYPYTGGVELSLVGQWFAPWAVSVMTVVAISGDIRHTYTMKITEFTSHKISCLAPDLTWMDREGGTLSLEVAHAGGTLGCDRLCAVQKVQVLSQEQTPRIESFSPYTGQAPLWITIYGSGFTKLAHSPTLPQSLRFAKNRFPTTDDSLAPVSEQETYVDVGAGPCFIVDMLNTRILCNLKDPCANLQANATLHLVSRGHGTTSTVSEVSHSLFFNCEMRATDISHAVGSAAGGQELNITGIGFPSSPALLRVTVAETECHVTVATTTKITCTTATSTDAVLSRGGSVQVYNRANGQQSTCCFYTFSTVLTPILSAVSPTTAAGGARLLLFGTNFPYIHAEDGGEGESGIHYTAKVSCNLTRGTSADPAMLVLFGARRLVVTDIESETRASVTVPHDYFGRDYLSVHVPGVGNSPPYTESLFTVLMMPAVTIPSAGGYRARVSMRLVGTSLGSNRPAGEVAELFRVFVCGRECDIQRTNNAGELVCRTPWYMDEELVNLYRGSLTFSKLLDGFTAHARAAPFFSETTAPSRAAEASSRSLQDGWSDVTALFTGSASPMYPYAAITPVVNIVASSLFLVLEAHLHSRLLLYSVTLTFVPTTPRANALDLSNARCRMRLATPQAEAATLFSAEANPLNASMWRSEDSNGAYDSRYMWPPLQLGTNTLHFALLEYLPTTTYVGIECEGMPIGTLQIQEASVAGYQVGLYPSGGHCPVNLRTQQRFDQPIMNSCSSRAGASCPHFQFRMSLTPIVTRFRPLAALTSDVGALITLHGSGFGNRVSAVAVVVLDKAACTPLTVTDTELTCFMEGRISSPQAWQVSWSVESRRGEAMLLSAQPFYAAVLWSSYLAWMGTGLPKEGNIVVLKGNTIMLDITPPPLSGILLGGVLIISDEVDVELRLGYLAITETGALIAGSAMQPHRHRFTLTLTLNRFQEDPLEYKDDILVLQEEQAEMDEPSYNRMLNVYEGTLQLHGLPPTVPRARLAHPASVGDTKVTVDRFVPWAKGDTIAIVTKHDPDPTHMEQRVIRRRGGNETHTVLFFESNAPLRYSHAIHGSGGRIEWEERWNTVYNTSTGTDVVYLSRTIVIRGDEISPLSEVGASVWIRNTTTSYLKHVELYRTGKRGTRQGYSLWLDSLRFPVNKVVLRDVVVHDAYYRGVVLEATRNAILSDLTVLYADGYGVAAVSANHERLTVTNSFLFGFHGNRGGLDTVAAGLYASSADVILENTEICASEGHGAWFALRFLFVAAQAPTCPAQNRLGPIRGNSLHHVRGHGLFVFPLQFNMGDRCQLTANIAAANDPEQVSVAAKAVVMAEEVPMKCAGEVSDQLIFSCGLYGIYLPPSNGYVVRSSAIIDCGTASLFLDYITNITEIADTFLAGVLPDRSCSKHPSFGALSSGERDDKHPPPELGGDGARCREKDHSAIEVQHGGHLFLSSIIVGDFADGAVFRLATLTTPSSEATSYPTGSYAARRSGHLTVRFFNFTAVSEVNLRFILAGRVALQDVDGRMSQSNKTSIFVYTDDMKVEAAPSFCTHVSSASSQSAHWSAILPADTLPSYRRVSWGRGRERKHAVMAGRTKTQLLVGIGATSGGGESDVHSPQEDLWMCTVPSKQLSLLFVEAVSGSTTSSDEGQPLCQSMTLELRENDHSQVKIFMNLTTSSRGAGTSAMFYLLIRDDVPPNEDTAETARAVRSGVRPVWRPPVEDEAATSTAEATGAGFYTLESSTNMLLTFHTASGSLCSPTRVSLKVDTSLAWPTAELLLQVRVSPNTIYFQPQSGTQTFCSVLPLMGEVRWYTEKGEEKDDKNSDPLAAQQTLPLTGSSADQGNHLNEKRQYSRSSNETARTLDTSGRTESITAWLRLALNPLCLDSSTRANKSGPWNTSPSLWADVQLRRCEKKGTQESGCVGPHLPYLRPFTQEDPFEGYTPHTSWYVSTAWEGGRAPWMYDNGEEKVPSGEQAVFVIPYGTRVHLNLEEAVRVPGVLLVVGELLVTVAPAGTACTPASQATIAETQPKRPVASCTSFSSGKHTTSVVTLTIQTLIVIGKLNVSSSDATAPTLRIILGARGVSSAPFQLDTETMVHPGAFYAAGEVTLTGRTDVPTVWRATSAIRANTSALPILTSTSDMNRLQGYCTRLVQMEAGEAVTTMTSLRGVVDKCVAASRRHLPSWMQRLPVSEDALLGLRHGSRVAVTSGSSRVDDAEVNTLTRDMRVSRFLKPSEGGQGSDIQVIVVTTKVPSNGTVYKAWSHNHGGVYAHDETPRLGTKGMYSEVVVLSKTIEFDCDAPRKSSESGCTLLITRQRHPVNIFPPPRFHASGVAFRHFGRCARGEAAAMPVVAPFVFLPALYVNVSAARSDKRSVQYRTSEEKWSATGYFTLAGCIIEDSYGPALYTDSRNTHLFMVDSAVWNSDGGGVRLDGSGIGVFMIDIVVAGTRYARSAYYDDTVDWSEPIDLQVAMPLTLKDTRVSSLCSVLVNHSHASRSSLPIMGDTDAQLSVATAAPFMKNVVAAGSESEGFCVPWDGSGGPSLMANNTAHSSFIGLFLFRAAKSTTQTDDATLGGSLAAQSGSGRSAHSAIQDNDKYASQIHFAAPVTPRVPKSFLADMLYNSGNAASADGQLIGAATHFVRWTLYGNRFLGLYSSGHENVTISDSDIFANPIGVALAVYPGAPNGSSRVSSSYIATFPGCSMTAPLLTSRDRFREGDADPDFTALVDVREWDVCHFSAYAKPSWTSRGCGPITFVDQSYHYAGVLALPSYEYVPLSYSRRKPVTAPSRSLLEAATNGQLYLENVLFGGVGELTRCVRAGQSNTGNPSRSILLSAAVMGAGSEAIYSSASLGSIILSQVQYASSCAPPMASTARGADSNGSPPLLSLAGWMGSVLRLRPRAERAFAEEMMSCSSSESVDQTDGLNSTVVYAMQRDSTPGNSSINVLTPVDVVGQRSLRAHDGNPYGMTVVYDMDGSAYHQLSGSRCYVARGASRNSSVTALLGSLCSISPLSYGELLVCPMTVSFHQVRLQSLDARKALASLIGRVSLTIAVASASEATAPKDLGSTDAMTILEAAEPLRTTETDTARQASLDASAIQIAFQAPLGTVGISVKPDAYPEALQVTLSACTAPALSSGATTIMRLPLMDEDITVHVWSERSRTQLAPASSMRSFSMPLETLPITADVRSPLASRISTAKAPLLPREETRWFRDTYRSSPGGEEESVLLLQVTCGARLRIHQLVYGTILLYTPEKHDAVTQRLLQVGPNMTVSRLMPSDIFPDTQLELYMAPLRLTTMSTYPSANSGEGTWLILKVEAVDDIAYSTTAATDAIDSFLKLIDTDTSYYATHIASTTPVPLTTSQRTLQSRLYHLLSAQAKARAPGQSASRRRIQEAWREGEWKNRSTNATASSNSFLSVGGLRCSVVLTMPVLLPSERARLNALLRAEVSTGRAGQETRVPFIAFGTAAALIVLLLPVYMALRSVLPSLQTRAGEIVEGRKYAGKLLGRSKDGPGPRPASETSSGREETAVRLRRRCSDLAESGVVWMAGVLRTKRVATLDNCGVTRNGEQVVIASSHLAHLSSQGKLLTPESSTNTQKQDASKTVMRQLFLLPDYNVLDAMSSDDRGHGSVTTVSPIQLEHSATARLSEPERTYEGEQQRYVSRWRIALQAMEALTQCSGVDHLLSSLIGSTGSNAGAVPPELPPRSRCIKEPGSTAVTNQPTPMATPSDCDGDGALGHQNLTTASPRFEGSSSWHRSPVGASSGSGPAVSMEAESNPEEGNSFNATLQPLLPEHIIPVRLSPLCPYPSRDLVTSYQDGPATACAAPQGSCIRPHPMSNDLTAADPSSGLRESSLAGEEPTATQLADMTLDTPTSMPVALQSILRTSLLAGNATRSSYNTDIGAVLATPANVVSGTPSLMHNADAHLQNTPQVLRGRGQIMFTTPSVHSTATGTPQRALRVGVRAVLNLRHQVDNRNEDPSFDRPG